MRSARVLFGVPLLAAAGFLGLPSGPAAAASCAGMTLQYDGAGTLVALHPAAVSVPYGGCVQFTNSTLLAATFTVEGGYSQQVAPGTTTPPGAAYVGRSSGTHGVTATSGPAQATGSISVGAAPAPPPSRSPSPTATHGSGGGGPSPQATSAGHPGPRHSRPPATVGPTPVVTQPPAPSHQRSHGGHPGGHQRGHPVPTFTSEPTVPSPLHTPAAVVSGPLEPPTDRAIGLPAAVAGLLIVGSGAALVRVLLAEPVDNVGSVGAGA